MRTQVMRGCIWPTKFGHVLTNATLIRIMNNGIRGASLVKHKMCRRKPKVSEIVITGIQLVFPTCYVLASGYWARGQSFEAYGVLLLMEY